MTYRRLVLLTGSLFLSGVTLLSQPAGKSAGSQGGQSNFAGEVHPLDAIKNKFPSGTEQQIVVCYKISPAQSPSSFGANSSQPYVLERSYPPEMTAKQHDDFLAQRKKTEADARKTGADVPFDPKICSDFGDHQPLYNGDRLVIAILDPQSIVSGNFELLGLNVVSQAGNPISTAPVRAFSATGFTAEAATTPPDAYYLTWQERLKGDTSPEIVVKALYKQDKTLLPNPSGPGGTPIPDTAVTLLDITYPQVHVRNYFNIATGIVWSSLRNPTFSREQSSAASPAQYETVTSKGSVTIDPVLLFMIYARPFDAETRWHASDLYKSLAFCGGLSLSSPATDYFLGLSTEIRRNVQLVGGVHIGKVTEVVPGLIPEDPSSSTPPNTNTRFTGKGFVGVTFDIDFIKSLFGGGGSTKAGS